METLGPPKPPEIVRQTRRSCLVVGVVLGHSSGTVMMERMIDHIQKFPVDPC